MVCKYRNLYLDCRTSIESPLSALTTSPTFMHWPLTMFSQMGITADTFIGNWNWNNTILVQSFLGFPIYIKLFGKLVLFVFPIIDFFYSLIIRESFYLTVSWRKILDENEANKYGILWSIGMVTLSVAMIFRAASTTAAPAILPRLSIIILQSFRHRPPL